MGHQIKTRLGTRSRAIKTELLTKVRAELRREREDLKNFDEEKGNTFKIDPFHLEKLNSQQTETDNLFSWIGPHLRQIEMRAEPRQNLSVRLKRRFFVFRLKVVERLVLRFHRTLFYDCSNGARDLSEAIRVITAVLQQQKQEIWDVKRMIKEAVSKQYPPPSGDVASLSDHLREKLPLERPDK